MESYVERIKTLIVSLTETYCETDINEHTKLETIGYDEVDLLELACLIEDEFGIGLSDATVELSMSALDWQAIVTRTLELQSE